MNQEQSKIFYERAKLIYNLDRIIASTRKAKIKNVNQLSLFGSEEETSIEIHMEEPDDFSPSLMVLKEKDVLGFNLSYSQFDEYELVRARFCNANVGSMGSQEIQSKNRTVLAEVRSIEYRDSKFGNKYAKVVFGDDISEERLYLFGDLYKKMISKCFINHIYLLTVCLNDDGSRVNIVNFMPVNEIKAEDTIKSVYITTTSSNLQELRLYLKCFMMGDSHDVSVKLTDLGDMILPSVCKTKVDNDNLLELRKKGYDIKLR